MIKNHNSRQSLIEYNERILSLFRASQKALKENMTKTSKEHGFTFPQMFLIFCLYKNPGTNLHDLSKQLKLSKSTVSGIVDRLVSQRVVIREIPEEDRRTVKLFLSPDFLKEFNVLEFKDQLIYDMIKDAPVEDLDNIIYGLEKLLEHINKN